jgi:hypothetical protein
VSVCLPVCVCVCVRVSLCPAIRFHISQRIFSNIGENIIWVMPRIKGYLFFRSHTARSCVLSARACVHLLIFERIISKCAGNILLLTISIKDYILFMFTHRARRFLLKFGVNIIHITISSKGYVLFMSTHRAHACERACASARVAKQSIIFGRIMFKFDGHILQMTTSYM